MSNPTHGKSSKRMPERVYAEYVKAKVSLLLEQHWYPSNLAAGYIERCWVDGKDPDEVARELFDGTRRKP